MIVTRPISSEIHRAAAGTQRRSRRRSAGRPPLGLPSAPPPFAALSLGAGSLGAGSLGAGWAGEDARLPPWAVSPGAARRASPRSVISDILVGPSITGDQRSHQRNYPWANLAMPTQWWPATRQGPVANSAR